MDSYDPRSRLANITRSLKKQTYGYLLLRGAVILTIFFLISIGLASILSFISTNPYFLATLKILIALFLLYLLAKLIISPIYMHTGTNSFLEKLDDISPGLKEDSLNALELTQDLDQSRNVGTSEDLAYGHISKTTLKLESFDLSSIYHFNEYKKYLAPLFSSIIFAVLAIYLSSWSFSSFFFSTDLIPGKAGDYLQLADIEITLKYPEYTKLEPKVLKDGSEEVRAVKGTEVYFQAKPLNGFNTGELIINNGIAVPVEKIKAKIKSEFSVISDGTFFIKETTKGLSSQVFNVISEEDKKPEVKIYSPSGDRLELGSEEKIDIFYEAGDDFEISKITLNWENQKDHSETPIKTDDSLSDETKGKLIWGPAGVNPEDGETIKLRVVAYDNDTITGPKAGISNPITIKLKDARSKHRETLNFAEQFMEELIDILGDEINLFSEGEKIISAYNSESAIKVTDPPEFFNKQKRLTQKIEHAVSTLEIALSSMAEDEYSDYTFFVGLTNMEFRINDLLDERKYLIESHKNIDIAKINHLIYREITEFENDILLLDSILKGDKLIDSLRASNELLNEYSELSDLLNQLKEEDNEEIAGQIQDKLDQIKELMSKLAKQMDGLGGELQEGYLNQDAFEALNMQKQLDQISKLAKEGKLQEALNMLASMSQNLQKMIASLENGMQSFGSSMMAKEMSKLIELISRIQNIETQESSLKDNTERLKKSMLDNPGLPGQNLRDFIEKEMEKTNELTKSLKDARTRISKNTPKGSSPEGAYLIEKMIEKTEQLSNWLQAMDFNEAEKNAQSIQESTLGLKEMSNINYGSLGKAYEEIKNASRIAREIREDLKQFATSGGRKGPFDQMASRQSEIQYETGDLNKELSESGSGFFITPQLSEKLGQAENFMKNATDDLHGSLVSKAISNQEEALKSLREAKEQAQDMVQQMKMSAGGNGTPAPMMLGQRQSGQSSQGKDTRYVEIPAVDESQIGKEYKQQILEAMKGGSPEGYIKLNKKYYDRIIK